MEKTKILTLFPNCIPYVRELRDFTGSINAAILMQQLDYYFMSQPNGFYKFTEPSGHPEYREGDSWTETLNFSSKEFKNAWKHIGITYASKTAYHQIKDDKFQGKLYCAYIDRKQNNKTYYFRNHALVNERLDNLIQGKMEVDPAQTNGENPPVSEENHSTPDSVANSRETPGETTEPKVIFPTDQGYAQDLPQVQFPLDNTESTQEITTEEKKEKEQKEKQTSNAFTSLSSSSFGDTGIDSTGTQAQGEVSENVQPSFKPTLASSSKVPQKVSPAALQARTGFGQAAQPLIDALIVEFDHIDQQAERERLEQKLFEKYQHYGYSVEFMTRQLQGYLQYYAQYTFTIPKYQTADAFLDNGLNKNYEAKLQKLNRQNAENDTTTPSEKNYKSLSPEQKAKLQERQQNYEANKQPHPNE